MAAADVCSVILIGITYSGHTSSAAISLTSGKPFPVNTNSIPFNEISEVDTLLKNKGVVVVKKDCPPEASILTE